MHYLLEETSNVGIPHMEALDNVDRCLRRILVRSLHESTSKYLERGADALRIAEPVAIAVIESSIEGCYI